MYVEAWIQFACSELEAAAIPESAFCCNMQEMLENFQVDGKLKKHILNISRILEHRKAKCYNIFRILGRMVISFAQHLQDSRKWKNLDFQQFQDGGKYKGAIF